MFRDLIKVISSLACAISAACDARRNEFEWFKSHCLLATKQDLNKLKEEIMSEISEFAAKQNEYNDRLDAAVEGLTGDVKTLNDKIAKLQDGPGKISPEDQALLDEIQTRSQAIVRKFEALDELTPPPVPVGPEPPVVV